MERIKRLARPIGWWEIIIYFYLNKKANVYKSKYWLLSY